MCLAINGKCNSDLLNHISASCPRPDRYCSHKGATFKMQDCDGDGIQDPVCTDENGQFGVIQSSKECTTRTHVLTVKEGTSLLCLVC